MSGRGFGSVDTRITVNKERGTGWQGFKFVVDYTVILCDLLIILNHSRSVLTTDFLRFF